VGTIAIQSFQQIKSLTPKAFLHLRLCFTSPPITNKKKKQSYFALNPHSIKKINKKKSLLVKKYNNGGRTTTTKASKSGERASPLLALPKPPLQFPIAKP